MPNLPNLKTVTVTAFRVVFFALFGKFEVSKWTLANLSTGSSDFYKSWLNINFFWIFMKYNIIFHENAKKNLIRVYRNWITAKFY